MRFQILIDEQPIGTLDLGVQGIGSRSLVICPAGELHALLYENGHAAEHVHFDLVSSSSRLEGCHVIETFMAGSALALRLAFARNRSLDDDS